MEECAVTVNRLNINGQRLLVSLSLAFFSPLSPKLFPLQLYNPLTRSGWYLGCAEFVFLITSTWANPPEKLLLLLLWYKNSRMITFPHAIRPVRSGKYFTPLKVKCAWR